MKGEQHFNLEFLIILVLMLMLQPMRVYVRRTVCTTRCRKMKIQSKQTFKTGRRCQSHQPPGAMQK